MITLPTKQLIFRSSKIIFALTNKKNRELVINKETDGFTYSAATKLTNMVLLVLHPSLYVFWKKPNRRVGYSSVGLYSVSHGVNGSNVQLQYVITANKAHNTENMATIAFNVHHKMTPAALCPPSIAHFL